MSVSNLAVQELYQGDAVTTSFAIPFASIPAEPSNIKVYDVSTAGVLTLKTISTHYTLSPNNTNPTSVSYNSAPGATTKVLIIRSLPITQLVDFINGGTFNLEDIEECFDRLTLIAQEIANQANRALRINVIDQEAGTLAVLLPPITVGEQGVISVKADGTGFEFGTTVERIEDAIQAATDAETAQAAAESAQASAEAAETAADAAQTAAEAAQASAEAADDSAQEWATKTNGIVDAIDFSSKAWAVGGTDVTETTGRGASKEWATKTDDAVDTSEYSAKEYAVGTQRRGLANGGSAKDWANYVDGGNTVDDTEFSAKYWAQQASLNAQSLPLITGTKAAPRTIVAATGFTEAAGHLDADAINQTVYAKGPGAGDAAVSANPQIEAPVSPGQRLRIIGASLTDRFSLDTGNGLILDSGIWYSAVDRGDGTFVNNAADFEANTDLVWELVSRRL